jgi:hypothetical protein
VCDTGALPYDNKVVELHGEMLLSLAKLCIGSLLPVATEAGFLRITQAVIL